MKRIKERVQKSDQDLLEEGKDFLTNTLLPIAESNAEQKKQRRKKMISRITSSIACLIILTVSGFWLADKISSNYSITYETIVSDIDFLNSTLTNTQLMGDYKVDLTYETRRRKPVYFITNRQERTDENRKFLTITVVVDPSYKIKENGFYAESFKFLEYTVYYNKIRDIELSEEITIYNYDVKAFIDTGAEKYVIDYTEISVNDNYTFEEYLEGIIKIK